MTEKADRTGDSGGGGESGSARPGGAFPGVPARAWLALALVVLWAGGLRFAGLDRVPAGLFRDEAEKGYNAWAILKAGGAVEFSAGEGGRAVIGWNSWPFVIDVMGVRTSAIYQYASVPFIAAGGLTAGTTRMAAAMAGTLAVALLGMLLLRVWGRNLAPGGAALIAALWLALCPWHVVFSRWALQGIFVPVGMIGVLAGAAGAERGRRWGFPLAGAALGFMFYAYSGAQPFVLAWAAGLAALYAPTIVRLPLSFAVGVALMAVGVVPRLVVTLQEGGAVRLDAVAIWTEEGSTAGSVAAAFARNYLSHFDPIFLFVRGDALPRHGIAGLGQLLLIDAVLLPVGLVASFRRKLPLRGALALAFVLGPVGAAITRVGIPHALRALPMVVPAAVWGGLGLAVVSEWVVKRVEAGASGEEANRRAARSRGRALAAVGLAAAMMFGMRVFGIYWTQQREDAAVRAAFSASEREAFEEVAAARGEGERVWVSGGILYAPYFAMFFEHLPPRATAVEGLEAQGIVVFPPGAEMEAAVRERMRAGDWMISYDAATGEAGVWWKGE